MQHAVNTTTKNNCHHVINIIALITVIKILIIQQQQQQHHCIQYRNTQAGRHADWLDNCHAETIVNNTLIMHIYYTHAQTDRHHIMMLTTSQSNLATVASNPPPMKDWLII